MTTFKIIIPILAITLSCNNILTQKNKIENLAWESFDIGAYQDAFFYADSLIRLDSLDDDAWTIRGRCRNMLKKHQEAIEDFNVALNLNKENKEALQHRAYAYWDLGNSDAAITDLTLIIEEHPDDTTIINSRAGLFYTLKKYDLAIKDFNRVIKLHPNNYDAIIFCASAKKNIGLLDEALKMVNRAISLSPHKSFAYEEKGHILTRLEDFRHAVEAYSKNIMISIEKDNDLLAYSFNNRGYAYYKLGKLNKAERDINKSIEMLPSNSFAFKNKALLRIAKLDYQGACQDLAKAIELNFTEKYGDEVNTLIDKHCK